MTFLENKNRNCLLLKTLENVTLSPKINIITFFYVFFSTNIFRMCLTLFFSAYLLFGSQRLSLSLKGPLIFRQGSTCPLRSTIKFISQNRNHFGFFFKEKFPLPILLFFIFILWVTEQYKTGA